MPRFFYRPSVLFACLAAATAAIYSQFLWNPIVFDDYNYFGIATRSGFLNFAGFFHTRWLPYATFEWTRALLGVEVVWYRLGNLALHIGVVGMLFFFLRALFCAVMRTEHDAPGAGPEAAQSALSPLWLAFSGALIFALHPASVYATAYLVQRTSQMATLFVLLMWFLFVRGVSRESRGYLLASAAAYLLAVLSKEHAIMAPAVAAALLFLLRAPNRKLWRLVAPAFVLYAAIGIYVALYLKAGVLGYAYEPRGVDFLAELALQDADFDPRWAYPLSVLTQSLLFFKYWLVWIMPTPQWMSVDMFEPFATHFWSWPHLLGLLGFMLYPCVALWLLFQRGTRGLLGFGMLCPWLMFATELSTIRIQESFVLYRTYLWMPGAMAVLPFLFQKTPARRTALVLTALLLVMLPVTWGRLTTFSSPLLLWNDAARLISGKDDRPGVERIYHNRGLHLAKLGYLDEAIQDMDKALVLNPRHVLVYNDRGATYLALKKYPQALADFNKAIELESGFVRPYLGRAMTYERIGNATAALKDYRALCTLDFAPGCVKSTQMSNSQPLRGTQPVTPILHDR